MSGPKNISDVEARMADRLVTTSLEEMGVKSVSELLALPTAEIATRLTAAPFPPSEKLIGAVLLKAVDDLRGATERIDSGTTAMLAAARLTLAVAVAALVVSILSLANVV